MEREGANGVGSIGQKRGCMVVRSRKAKPVCSLQGEMLPPAVAATATLTRGDCPEQMASSSLEHCGLPFRGYPPNNWVSFAKYGWEQFGLPFRDSPRKRNFPSSQRKHASRYPIESYEISLGGLITIHNIHYRTLIDFTLTQAFYPSYLITSDNRCYVLFVSCCVEFSDLTAG